MGRRSPKYPRRFTHVIGFQDQTKYLEYASPDSAGIPCKADGSPVRPSDPTNGGYYRLEVALRWVDDGDWKEIFDHHNKE